VTKAANVKVVSVDLGGTLVDFSQSLRPIWRTLLGNDCPNDSLKHHWDRATEILREKLSDAAKGETGFKNIRAIFQESFEDFFSEIRLDFDPRVAAEKWIRGHDLRNVYADAKLFLAAVDRKYRLCLSSDCDLEMIADIDELYSFDAVFSSESLKCYKLDPQFWMRVSEHYGLPTDNILHVGDDTSDIVGPAKLGILTCWVNRGGRKWDHEVKPDFEVTSLSRIAEILGN